MVEITPTAAAEIKRIKLNREIENGSLRLKVVSGGCSDLYYDLKLESTSAKQNLSSHGDRLMEINGINLLVDPQSWKYVENLKLDYSEDLMGGGFRFHNPKLTNICGCGISFAKLGDES
ncbi:MAG: iron-sulfur cluster assembly accessory protein [Cyanobacteria bacterium P01_G01_bin.67]